MNGLSRNKTRGWLRGLAIAGLLRLFGALSLCAVLAVVLAPPVAAQAFCPNEALRTEANSSLLPDCRVYELVSPPQKNGAEVEKIVLSQSQSAEDGSAVTYMMTGPIVDNPAGNSREDRVLSTRGSGGWSSQDISTAHTEPTGADSPSEYRYFSTNLESAIFQPGAPEYGNAEPFYLRNTTNGIYESLVTTANLPSSAKVPVEPRANAEVRFAGASPDLNHIVVAIEGAGLYERNAGGQVQPVSVLPNSSSVVEGSRVAGFEGDARNDVSQDGSHVIWETGPGGYGQTGHHLYQRDMTAGATVQVDAAQGLAEPTEGGASFQTASGDGSEVFFTDNQVLTPKGEPGDLYAFDAGAVEGERLTDVTVDEHSGEAADVRGLVPGASEDGSYVYFVATGALSGGKNANEEVATPGANNLYVAHSDGHGWTTTFIAALSPADRPDWGNEDVTPTLEESTSRVSPNGRYLVFMSERGLTAYNNLDAVSNEPDQEVYEYDSSSNRVICASCNPSGSRPVGVFNGSDLLTARRVFVGSWLAASVPGWYGTNNDIYAPHQPRYLSDSGRLFLDSPEAYALQDTNGVEDVYEYEPDGVGGCGSATGPEGVTAYGGGACLALISGGTGSEESAFAAASGRSGE